MFLGDAFEGLVSRERHFFIVKSGLVSSEGVQTLAWEEGLGRTGELGQGRNMGGACGGVADLFMPCPGIKTQGFW